MMLRKVCSAAIIVFLAVCAVLLPPGSGDLVAQESGTVLPVDRSPLVVETREGRRSFTVEVADSAPERERGLMFRESMKPDHGMLFVFEQERDVGFWMKNTPMPLDLVFISADGTIKAIKRGLPFSEASISAGVPVRFVLELRAGIAVASGMKIGDKVRHPLIGAPVTVE